MSASSNRVSEVQQSSVQAYQAVATEPIELGPEATKASSPFVGQWRTLVSTTNWEKGRIVTEWRTSLENSGASAAEYSDDAWAQLVGGVTGQHVGRLRRVFQRFGEVYPEYAGLYWSHFQAASEWDDAEMWLEGAVQNGWSVSQTRAKRWETVGDGKPDPLASRGAADELMEEGPAAIDAVARETTGEQAAVRDSDTDEHASPGGSQGASGESADLEVPFESTEDEPETPTPDHEPTRPFADLPEFPEDVADAFEQFKLAILAHKLSGWQDVSRDDIVGALESLKQLAMAPADPAE